MTISKGLLDLSKRHLDAGRADLARRILEQLIAAEPAFWPAHHHLASALAKIDQALARFHAAAALALAPAEAGPWFDMASLVPESRLPALERAARLRTHPSLLHHLGVESQRAGRTTDAKERFAAALALEPAHPANLNNLGLCLTEHVEFASARAAFRRAVTCNPGFHGAASNALMTCSYDETATREGFLDMARDSRRSHGRAQFAARALIEDPRRDRRLRIGYLPAETAGSAMGRFLDPLLRHLDEAEFEPHLFGPADIAALDDETLAASIRARRIDVLIDLGGSSAQGRLGVFARRAAPLQISWLGAFASTGLAEIDAIIMDPVWVPRGAESWFLERVVKLPETRFCYEARIGAPAVAQPPALDRGMITFGSFNRIAKLNDKVIALWSVLLDRVPDSRLKLKAIGLDQPREADRLRRRFAAYGVPGERIAFAGQSGPQATLAAYAEIDIALDPFPFGGGLTSCDALWMGVPLVTLIGASPVSRQGLSFLTQIERQAWAADSEAAYLDIAAGLASDLSGLARIRAELRQRMAASPLCDGARFARNFEAMLRGLWRDLLAGL